MVSLMVSFIFHTRFFSLPPPCSASADRPEKVNMTAEEDAGDDEDVPDIRTFRVSPEESHLYAGHANGRAARFRHWKPKFWGILGE